MPNKKAVFTLTGPDEGKNKVILDRYMFVDGKMEIRNLQDAEKIATILCVYYGVEMTIVEETAEAPAPANPSLSADQTKK